MVIDNRIFFGKVDLTSAIDMQVVQRFILTNNLRLTTCYLSNIPEWLTQQRASSWAEAKLAVEMLLQPCTQLIDAFYPTNKKDSSGPPLRITQAKLPSFSVEKYDSKKANPRLFQAKRILKGKGELNPHLNAKEAVGKLTPIIEEHLQNKSTF